MAYATFCQGGHIVTGEHRGSCLKCAEGIAVALFGTAQSWLEFLASVKRRIVDEILPTGRDGNSDARLVQPVTPPSVIVKRRARLSVEDQARAAFLASIEGDLLDVIGARWTSYQAFLFRLSPGCRICIAESYIVDNAMYIIDATAEGWDDVIQLDRPIVRRRPEFLGRIVHQGDWQQRAMEIIERSRPAAMQVA